MKTNLSLIFLMMLLIISGCSNPEIAKLTEKNAQLKKSLAESEGLNRVLEKEISTLKSEHTALLEEKAAWDKERKKLNQEVADAKAVTEVYAKAAAPKPIAVKPVAKVVKGKPPAIRSAYAKPKAPKKSSYQDGYDAGYATGNRQHVCAAHYYQNAGTDDYSRGFVDGWNDGFKASIDD